MSSEKAEELLKYMLKPLYYKINKKWTPEDDDKISTVINELRRICDEP